MEKMLESISTISHQLTVSDRKQIMLTGIKKINIILNNNKICCLLLFKRVEDVTLVK